MYYTAIKIDKITGVVVADKSFTSYADAERFINEVADAFGYEPAESCSYLYERGNFALTIN